MRLGVFGGTFDPIHFGHLRAALEVQEGLGLDEIAFVPSYQPPHKRRRDLTDFDHRLNLVERAISCIDSFKCLDIEKRLPIPSFTVNTLKALRSELSASKDLDLYFLMGSDAFFELKQWHDPEGILELANLVVMARGKNHVENLMEYARKEFSEYLKKGRIVPFKVTRLEISSSKIRTLRRGGHPVHYLLPQDCIKYMEEHKIYMEKEKGPERLNLFIEAVKEGHGERVVALDVRGLSSICDYFIIAQGRSTRHVQGTADKLRERLKKERIYPLDVEGEREGKWILLDYGDIVIHLFYEPMREFYDLEGLWHEARRVVEEEE